MVPHMVHLQDVVKLHTFVLGDLAALLLACFGFDLRFALVVFDLGSDSIWCEGVGVGVGARGGSTWAGGDYLSGALGWERRTNLRTTNKARSHTHTQAQATQALHRGPPTPIPTAFQHRAGPTASSTGQLRRKRPAAVRRVARPGAQTGPSRRCRRRLAGAAAVGWTAAAARPRGEARRAVGTLRRGVAQDKITPLPRPDRP